VPEDVPLEVPPLDEDELEELAEPDDPPELPELPAFGGDCCEAWVDPAPPGSLPPQATSTQAPRKLTTVRIDATEEQPPYLAQCSFERKFSRDPAARSPQEVRQRVISITRCSSPRPFATALMRAPF
jgi:hypothetical protein